MSKRKFKTPKQRSAGANALQNGIFRQRKIKSKRYILVKTSGTSMTYSIFMDDERLPPESMKDALVVRDFDSFFSTIDARGWPSLISFDHDLGDGPTGYDVAIEIVERLLNDVPPGKLPFEYRIHSADPIGARNIDMLFSAYVYHFDKMESNTCS